MNTFSFRAECQEDVSRLHDALTSNTNILFSMISKPIDSFPDVEVELQSSADLDQLRDIFRTVVDGHVMLQTLRPCTLSENSLERDYSLH